jgi:hypothetical protein
MKKLDINQIQIYKETSQELTGSNRRCFQAKNNKSVFGRQAVEGGKSIWMVSSSGRVRS